MGKTIEFTVYGEPVAQGRPKFYRRGNHVGAYDPKKSSEYKDTVYSEAVKNKPAEPLEGPLSLTIRVYKSIPKSFSKKKTQDAIEYAVLPTTKPDLDNYVKGIKDALKGVIWRDDSQVALLLAKKRYALNPRIEIEISEIVN